MFSAATLLQTVCAMESNFAGGLVLISQVKWAMQTSNYRTTILELDENIVQFLYFSHMVHIDSEDTQQKKKIKKISMQFIKFSLHDLSD
jgi:hypothetical protein